MRNSRSSTTFPAPNDHSCPFRALRIKRVKLLARPKGLLRMGVGHLAFIIAQCDAQSRLWLGVKT